MASPKRPTVAESRVVPFFLESATPATNAVGPATRALPALTRLSLSSPSLSATCLPQPPLVAGGVTEPCTAQRQPAHAMVACAPEDRVTTKFVADHRPTTEADHRPTAARPVFVTDQRPTIAEAVPAASDVLPNTADVLISFPNPPDTIIPIPSSSHLLSGDSMARFSVPGSSVLSISTAMTYPSASPEPICELESSTSTFIRNSKKDAGATFLQESGVVSTSSAVKKKRGWGKTSRRSDVAMKSKATQTPFDCKSAQTQTYHWTSNVSPVPAACQTDIVATLCAVCVENQMLQDDELFAEDDYYDEDEYQDPDDPDYSPDDCDDYAAEDCANECLDDADY